MRRIATSSNKVIKTDLSVTYEVDREDSWYVVTRHATKSYSIVDLDAESAAVIANQRVAIYTRPYSVLVSSGGGTMPSVRSLTNCLAKVFPRHDTGPVWRVDVDLDETDVKVSATEPADPATLFTAENARDYDETDDIVKTAAVTSAKYDGNNAVIAFSSNFGDDVICQKFNTTANAWEPIFVQPSGGVITIPDGAVVGGDRVRVISGRTKSNAIAVELVRYKIMEASYDPNEKRLSFKFVANRDIAPGETSTMFFDFLWYNTMYREWSDFRDDYPKKISRDSAESNVWQYSSIWSHGQMDRCSMIRVGYEGEMSDPFDI